jgi:hypothetical protein
MTRHRQECLCHVRDFHPAFEAGCLHFGVATLSLISQPSVEDGDEMGRNEVSAFVCNASGWGHMGRNGLSPLEMGIEGRGRVSRYPHSQRRKSLKSWKDQ